MYCICRPTVYAHHTCKSGMLLDYVENILNASLESGLDGKKNEQKILIRLVEASRTVTGMCTVCITDGRCLCVSVG